MTNRTVRLIPPPSIADARSGIRHVFVRDLVQMCAIGVHAHERQGTQRVRLNLDLAVYEGDASHVADDIKNVVCYEDVAKVCLTHAQVRSVRVRVEKLDVFEDVSSVGVEIERFNPEV